MTDNNITTIELTEESIESLVFEIRGKKVMLDCDLAKIYGYTTKAFNQQVKNNIEKFPEDFMFQLTDVELRKANFITADYLRPKGMASKNSVTKSEEISRSIFLTTMQTKGIRGGRAYLPYAFTEQGVYMLMTVLKGDLAIKQSIALIRFFKRMKDYIAKDKEVIDFNVSLINDKFLSFDKKFEEVDEKLRIVMDNFIDPSTYKRFLIFDGQKIEADIAYQTIYSLAESSLYIIDDYVGIKTLQLLKGCSENISIILFSDNKSKNPLSKTDINDFISDTGFNFALRSTKQRFHDRYIVIDYNTTHEIIYHCGTSSKDAGKRVTTIMKEEMTKEYHYLIDELLNNKETNAEKKQ